jgi:23S rRNA (uridine2552-2'-O)-methyltransferase
MIDKFTKKAKYEGYKARAVYKLKSINSRFKLVKKGVRVLDLGGSPGSWSQYCIEEGASVDAVDLDEIKVEGVNFIQSNVFADDLLDKLGKYDLVLSDLAPKAIGVRKMDNEHSFDLSIRALEISREVLERGGSFVCKIFQSEYFDKFVDEVKKTFKIVKVIKPMASKKRSKEMYVVGIRKN